MALHNEWSRVFLVMFQITYNYSMKIPDWIERLRLSCVKVEIDRTSVLKKALFYVFLLSLLGLDEALDVVLFLTVSETGAKT